MMHYYRIFFRIATLFISCTLYAQPKTTSLKGYLGVEGGESYTYKLVFSDSAGFINGYSYTYLHEQKEVKATITGSLDSRNKTLSFRETNIIYNHGFESNTTICLINAILKYGIDNSGHEAYSGSITSSDIGNVYCGQGTVSFPVSEEISSLFTIPAPSKPVQPPITDKKSLKNVKIIYDTASSVATQTLPQKQTNEPEKITAGTEKFIEWHSDTVVIEVWDGGIVDGDNISIDYNGKSLLSKHTLSKEHTRLTTMISQMGTDEIVFTANHEGNQPPMTANVVLVDRNERYDIIVYNPIGKQAKIRLKKVK